jgi:hypothetical protein
LAIAVTAVSVKATLLLDPLKLAVNMTGATAADSAQTENVALELPAHTSTLGGAESAGLLAETLTPMGFPNGTGAESDTVHVPLVQVCKLTGPHTSDETVSAPVPSDKIALWELDPRVAVIDAVSASGITPAAAVKLAEALPAGTTTEPGTVTRSEVEESDTDVLVVTACDNVTLHKAEPSDTRLDGLHTTAETWVTAAS